MNDKKPFNYFYAVILIIIGAALYKNFDQTTGDFKNPGLAIVYGLSILLALFNLLRRKSTKFGTTWITNYENNKIKVTNTWFSGEELYVNDVLQDKKFGAASSNLTGHLFTSNNEKQSIKANLFGWSTINCTLFINDKEVNITQER